MSRETKHVAAGDTPIATALTQRRRLAQQLDEKKLAHPRHTRVIAFANQKGGVGKTTSAVNIAAALAKEGMKVVLIDADPQGNASTALQVNKTMGIPGTYEVLISQRSLADVLQPAPLLENLQVAAATLDLSGADIELIDIPQREYQLRRAVDKYTLENTEIDYIIIDCPPSLGLLTLNAFVAATEVMIPIQAEYYALEGVALLRQTIDRITRSLNRDLRVTGVLLTMTDTRTNLSREVVKEVHRAFPDIALETTIPRTVRLSEAPSYGETIMTFDPQSIGALAYRRAMFEIAERG